MVIAALFTFCGLLLMASNLGPNVVPRIYGYNGIIDLIVSAALLSGVMTTGTISGLMLGIFTGIFISVGLRFGRIWFGYQRWTELPNGKRKWVQYPPKRLVGKMNPRVVTGVSHE